MYSLQIVGLGLRGVFELIWETRENYPELCIKAMKSLLDMLQGQLPESMKLEPADIVGKVWFDFLFFWIFLPFIFLFYFGSASKLSLVMGWKQHTRDYSQTCVKQAPLGKPKRGA